jgi:CRP/FNR family transcriptional regulator
MLKAEELRERLRRVPLFSELEDADLDRLAGIARVQRFEKKALLFSEDEPYRGMFVILTGLAVVYKTSDQGRMLILQVCRPGASVAETPLLEDGPDIRYPAYAKCTRDSEVLFLPREKFGPFLRHHPEVAWEMLRMFAARVREMALQLEGITLREVTTRLARYLLAEVAAAGAEQQAQPDLTLPLAKGTLASYLGTVQETLSRTLARLSRDGIIEVDGPRVRVLDLARLPRLS